MNAILEKVKKAKAVSYGLAQVSSGVKNKALLQMARGIRENYTALLRENKKDLDAAQGLDKAFIDRLSLDKKRLEAMADSLTQVASLKDPIGEVIDGWRRPNGLWIQKVRVPIGVAAIIYESRPNVTSDCIGLCLKSSNACILKGGSEAINTNRAIFTILSKAARAAGIPEGAMHFIDTAHRKALSYLLGLSGYIDVVIPRGGEGLINFVQGHTKIPVIKHYKGICHVYVDKHADLAMAEDICFNAKVSRPGVCNAMEAMLVHKDCAAQFLPAMIKKFRQAKVEIRGCDVTRGVVKEVKKAKEIDWSTEYLSLILSVKVVQNIEQAIAHINQYGSHHSDSIVTEKYERALIFLNMIDSACVYVNASTRFTDGYEFGLGSEIGISTDKLHARGPMGLEELTTYKYMVFGNGQIRT